ncbi:MAG TPA: hypothetical protein PLO23_06850 [Alphaproteobacteria bacterium]|nr:hypothetical protein [Alphaproteobacteria bacterium]
MKEFLLKHFLKQTPEHLLYPGPQFSPENTVVNYIWIDYKPWKSSGPGDALCGARLSYFDKAYEQALQNPDAQFIMWVDFSRMDDLARFWVTSHYANWVRDNFGDLESPRVNLKLKDISKLPDYQQASLQIPETDLYKTRRPDLARLYVMRECLRIMPEKTYIMYCDLDVENVRIGCPQSQRILGQHGMVHTYVTSLNNRDKGEFLGLGYFIFRRDIAENFLNKLIPVAEKRVVTYGDSGICGAMMLALIDWQAEAPGRKTKELIHPDRKILYPVGHITPEDPIYAELGINY